MPESKFLSAHRNAFNRFVDMIEKAGDSKSYVVNNSDRAIREGKKNVRVAQSFLCSEIALTTATSYVLNVMDNKYNVGSSNLYPGEQRIKMQDVFWVYGFGFFIRPISPGGGTYNNQLQTFPSAQFFGSGGANLQELLGLWTTASMNYSIGGEIVTPAWDISKHMYIPQTQVPAISIAGSMPFDQVNLDEDGQLVVEPNWIINGGNDNQFIVNYNSDYAAITQGTLSQRICVKWYGFLAQNISSIMDNIPKNWK